MNNISLDVKLLEKAVALGLINKISAENFEKNCQIQFYLKNGYAKSEVFKDANSNDLLITIQSKSFENTSKESFKEKWKFDCVVIDAGHGGKDPGAIGKNGTYEKEINLGVALQLGSLIKKNMPDVKVIYTRSNDKFVELYKRGKIANENNGKLFISLHCNSLAEKSGATRGFEIYLLRPGRTQEAIEIAEFENSVIKFEENPSLYSKLNDENFILVSMAHSSYMRYSETFSDFVNQDWKLNVDIPSKGIKQAGFYVLVGASMPSVLIELGFISNKTEESYLKSKSGQVEIANSLFKSIKRYRENYEKTSVE